MEELQKRIQKLDDIKQIERLQRIYGYYQDYSEWEKVVDLFSDNAESVKENGKWLFSKLHWNNTFCSPFEDGWLNLLLMGWMALPDADEPPSAFHPYPDHIQNVPYHFNHPITGE